VGEEGVSGCRRPSRGCGPGPSGRVQWRPSGAHGAALIPHALGQADRARRSKASNGPSGSRVGGRGTRRWSWPPAEPCVPRGQLPGLQGGDRRCPPPGSSNGDNTGCPELASGGGNPYPHGHIPPPWSGVMVNTAEHRSSKFSPKQPWACESVSRGLQLCPCYVSPRPAVLGQGSRPPQPAVLGLLLAQAGGRQEQGQARSTRTLLRINFFTKGKPNTFPTMN